MKKNELKIVKGDLFTHSGGVLAHGVNAAGAMGAGIAVLFKKKWPGMYTEYHKECKEGNIVPGMAWKWESITGPLLTEQDRLAETVGVTVYNLAIKSHWRNPASYNAIEASVDEMLIDMHQTRRKSVAMPWIGCGLGGLDQGYVTKILKRCLVKAEPGHTIWVYEK